MLPTFKLNFFRGDTKAFTARLSMEGEPVNLTGWSVRMIVCCTGLEIHAVVDGESAVFFFDKATSAGFSVGCHNVMVVYENADNLVQHPGILTVAEGVV